MKPDEPGGGLRRYAAERAARERSAGDDGASAMRRWLGSTLPRPYREGIRRWLTHLLLPYSLWRARGLARRRPLRLHLGCGTRRLPDWLNIDLAGSGADLAWHLGRRLPFAGGSARAIFAEHLVEHLTLDQALALADEARRLLEPGGVLRLGVPDFGRYAAAYLGRGELIDRYRPGRPTPLLALSEVAYLHGHRSIWDQETLVELLRETGFDKPTALPFGDSAIKPVPDSRARRTETLYVEAVR